MTIWSAKDSRERAATPKHLTVKTASRVAAIMLCAFGGRELAAQITVVRNNYGTGDMTVPGYPVSETDLLQTHLVSASRTGAPGSGDLYFYREDSGYPVDLTRLYNGSFGAAGADPGSSVLPNQTTLTFFLDLTASPGGYTINTIRTYAAWDDGRDGQAYTVEYSTVTDPTTFLPMATVTRYDNTDFPLTRTSYDFDFETGELHETIVPDTDYSHTMVELTGSNGYLAADVAQLRFNFNGIENGGTAYREFDVMGVTAVPEPATYATLSGAALLAFAAYRRYAFQRRPNAG